MRSQKQSNRSPRPFKTRQDSRGWSGGHRPAGPSLSDAIRKAFKTVPTLAKPNATPPASPPPQDSPPEEA